MSLASIYAKYSAPDGGGDKGTAHSYIDIYEREMSKTEGISLLEIGVWEGHSIAMWQEYFVDSEIIGIDIDPTKLLYAVPLIIGDATKHIKQLNDREFDYIIDDGSHRLDDQIASFVLLWNKVKSGGKYFIEDIAGESQKNALHHMLSIAGIEHSVYDNRRVKGRSDDIIIVATKG